MSSKIIENLGDIRASVLGGIKNQVSFIRKSALPIIKSDGEKRRRGDGETKQLWNLDCGPVKFAPHCTGQGIRN